MSELSWPRSILVTAFAVLLTVILGVDFSWKVAAVITGTAAMTEFAILHQNGHFRR